MLSFRDSNDHVKSSIIVLICCQYVSFLLNFMSRSRLTKTHTHTRIHTHARAHTHTHTHTHARTHAHTQTHTRTHAHTHTHTHTYIYIYTKMNKLFVNTDSVECIVVCADTKDMSNEKTVKKLVFFSNQNVVRSCFPFHYRMTVLKLKKIQYCKTLE